MVKLYIISDTPDGKGNINGLYTLVSEYGENLAQRYCSCKQLADIYIVWNDELLIKELNERFCKDNWDVFYLGDDEMTYKELINRRYDFYSPEKSKSDIKT